MPKHLHERRKVTFAELGALLGTRALLTDKLLVHDTVNDLVSKGEHLFRMNEACIGSSCGTASCIGGTMALIMGMTVKQAGAYVGTTQDLGSHSPALTPLFFPNISGMLWRHITARQAIRAIDNWLRDGKPRWPTATNKRPCPVSFRRDGGPVDKNYRPIGHSSRAT